MYDKIINPTTGKKVYINSVLGKKILKKYIYSLRGGASTDEDSVELSAYPLPSLIWAEIETILVEGDGEGPYWDRIPSRAKSGRVGDADIPKFITELREKIIERVGIEIDNLDIRNGFKNYKLKISDENDWWQEAKPTLASLKMKNTYSQPYMRKYSRENPESNFISVFKYFEDQWAEEPIDSGYIYGNLTPPVEISNIKFSINNMGLRLEFIYANDR